MLGHKEFIKPLTEANTGRIRTNVELPFHLSEQVGINTRFAEALLQIGGFRQARIIGDSNGDTSKAVPQIVGMDVSGAAVAGKAHLSTVPTQSYKYDQLDRIPRKQARWSDLNVTLNLAEMQSQIRLEAGSVKDPQAWAKKLNSALKKGIISAGLHHLVGDMRGYDKILSLFVYTGDIANACDAGLGDWMFGSLNPHAPTVETVLGEFISTGILWSIMDSILMGVEREGRGRRISLMLGPEIDRAVVLAIVGNLNRLVDTVGDK